MSKVLIDLNCRSKWTLSKMDLELLPASSLNSLKVADWAIKWSFALLLFADLILWLVVILFFKADLLRFHEVIEARAHMTSIASLVSFSE